jgi:hypothetical protein
MTSSPTNYSPTGSAVFALCGLIAALSIGCAQKPLCPELGNCGGPLPVGAWALSPGHPSCSEDLYNPPPDTRLVKADQPPARTTPPEVALYDWCDLLVTNGGLMIQTHPARFSFETGSIGAAWVRYDGAGNYSAGITRTGTYIIDFPALCMREFGAMDNRPADPSKDPNGPPVNICQQLQAQIVSTSTHRNTLCAQNPDDPAGCLCRFDVSDTKAGAGSYRLRDAQTILHLVNTSLPDMAPLIDFPAAATFCNKGSSLELTGANGEYLFNEPGLRTLDLGSVMINCTDGVLGPGEEGVDCGAACGKACGMAAAPMK